MTKLTKSDRDAIRERADSYPEESTGRLDRIDLLDLVEELSDALNVTLDVTHDDSLRLLNESQEQYEALIKRVRG